jgi:hypothetical protein
MILKNKRFFTLALLSLLFPVLSCAGTKPLSLQTVAAPTVYPHNQKLYDQYPWAAMYFYGVTVKDALVQIPAGNVNRWPEHLQSVELSYTLSEQNVVRRFFSPIVGVVQLAADVAVRSGSNEHTIYEFDPYIGFRWANLPWNDYVVTSLSIGEGISYDTSVPSLEARTNSNTKRLLNYLMLEATFSPPSYPRLQLVARIHHRSGAFGLYHAGNSGSNVLGLGVRYLFD